MILLIKLSEQISYNFFGVKLANSLRNLDRFAAAVEKWTIMKRSSLHKEWENYLKTFLYAKALNFSLMLDLPALQVDFYNTRENHENMLKVRNS